MPNCGTHPHITKVFFVKMGWPCRHFWGQELQVFSYGASQFEFSKTSGSILFYTVIILTKGKFSFIDETLM